MNLVKDFGNTKIVASPNGNTIHLSQSSHDTSLNRLFKSKRFNRLPKGREIVRDGTDLNCFIETTYRYAFKHKLRFLRQIGSHLFWYKPRTKDTAITDYGQVIEIDPSSLVFTKSVFHYSFTIKTSNMTTKAAPKAKASKAQKQQAPAKGKAKAAKSDDKGPGKIEQIIALHKQGLSNKEIAEKGFNKTTISIQVSKFKKAKEAAKASKKKA